MPKAITETAGREMKSKAKENSSDRLCDITGCRIQTDLVDLLGIRQLSISDAKKRNSIPERGL